MPICEKRKLAFCHIPRTGGVSVSNALNLKVVDKHYKASWYRKKYPGYALFTIKRAYEHRIKSAFGWIVPEQRENFYSLDELTESVIKAGDNNISLMLKTNEYFLDCPVDYELRFEHLQEDLDKMLTELGHNKIKLVKCNSFRK